MIVSVLYSDIGRGLIDDDRTGALAFIVLMALPVMLIVSLAIAKELHSVDHQQVSATLCRSLELKLWSVDW